MTCNFSGDILFVFFGIVISVLMIFYLMSISDKLGFNFKLFRNWVIIVNLLFLFIFFYSVWILTTFYYFKFMFLPFLFNCFALITLIISGAIYSFKPVKNESFNADNVYIKKLPVFLAIVTAVMTLLLTTTYPIFVNTINDYNKVKPPSFEDSVVAGVFFYENETNPYGADVSMYVINQNEDFYYDEVIFTLAFENESFNISIRKKNNLSDLTGGERFDVEKGIKRTWKYNNDKKHSNYTEILWNEETHDKKYSNYFYLAGATSDWPAVVYANFTVNYWIKDKNITCDDIKNARITLVKNNVPNKIFDFNHIGSKYKLKLLFGTEPSTQKKQDAKNHAEVFNQIKKS